VSFFKRLFSRSNLILKIDDGGRGAAGLLRSLQNFLIKKFMTIYLKLMKNLEQHPRPNLQKV
jgi:hypothetical protein